MLDRNWRAANGELDLILEGQGEIVFCEVKTRHSGRFGEPAEAVNWRKQRRIRALAVEWLRAHGRKGSLRFDVAAVSRSGVEVIEAAF